MHDFVSRVCFLFVVAAMMVICYRQCDPLGSISIDPVHLSISFLGHPSKPLIQSAPAKHLRVAFVRVDSHALAPSLVRRLAASHDGLLSRASVMEYVQFISSTLFVRPTKHEHSRLAVCQCHGALIGVWGKRHYVHFHLTLSQDVCTAYLYYLDLNTLPLLTASQECSAGFPWSIDVKV